MTRLQRADGGRETLDACEHEGESDGMGVTRRRMSARPSEVYAVLCDGHSYGDWVVGTRTIRHVEGPWPEPGAKLHYTVGYGPLRTDDETQALAVTPGRRLEMRAHAWPAGTARIVLEIEPAGEGSVVTIEEYPDQGLAKRLHNPLLDKLVELRNVETLRRLTKLAGEHATRPAR